MTPDGTDSLTTAQENVTQLETQRCVPLKSGNFHVDNNVTEQGINTCPAKKKLSEQDGASSFQHADNQEGWCYIYLHNRKIEAFKTYMDERSPFQTFVMKAQPQKRKTDSEPASQKSASMGNDRKRKEELACKTPQQLIIGGIVFIQGTPKNIQDFFKGKMLPITLVKDCATQRPAILSDTMMRPLRQVVELASERISFLPKPFAHYAKGHDRIRVIEGTLKGLEGCILRIDRDRKLVMQVGSLTLALAQAHREAYEVVPDEKATTPKEPLRRKLTCLQEQIDNNLFFPESQAEVEMYADNVNTLIGKAEELLEHGKEEMATDMLLFLLDEIFYHFDHLYEAHHFNLTSITTVKQRLTSTIYRLLSTADNRLSSAEKEHLSTEFDARAIGREFVGA